MVETLLGGNPRLRCCVQSGNRDSNGSHFMITTVGRAVPCRAMPSCALLCLAVPCLALLCLAVPSCALLCRCLALPCRALLAAAVLLLLLLSIDCAQPVRHALAIVSTSRCPGNYAAA